MMVSGICKKKRIQGCIRTKVSESNSTARCTKKMCTGDSSSINIRKNHGSAQSTEDRPSGCPACSPCWARPICVPRASDQTSSTRQIKRGNSTFLHMLPVYFSCLFPLYASFPSLQRVFLFLVFSLLVAPVPSFCDLPLPSTNLPAFFHPGYVFVCYQSFCWSFFTRSPASV